MKRMTSKMKLILTIFTFILLGLPMVKAEAATPPPAPTGLGIYSQAGNTFRLKWDLDANLLYYGDTSNFGYEVSITNLKGKEIMHLDTSSYGVSFGRISGTNFLGIDVTSAKLKKQGFKFKAMAYVYDAAGNKIPGAWSSDKVIIPRATVSKAGLVNNNKNKVKIKFNKISGAKSYTIYLSTNGGTKFKKVGTTKSTTYTINKSFERYKNYYVYVAANGVKCKKKSYNSTKAVEKDANAYAFVIRTVYR